MENKWQELQQVEGQRSDIITKLGRIEEKKATVSAEVYEKVKREYEEKLRNLDEKMTEYVDVIQKELAHIKSEEERLDQEEKDIQLKIEEIELRYSIGEYDDDSFQKFSDESKKNLSNITAELKQLKERMEWLKSFITDKATDKVIEQPAEPAPEEADIKIDEHIIKEKVPEEADIKIDEHILEEKVPEEDVKLDALLTEDEAMRPEPTEEAPVAEQEQTEQPSKEGGEQDKSVACPKCGAMNVPDSWYCEKCGAEILDSPAP